MNIKILPLNTQIAFLSRFSRDSALQWQVLAGFQALMSVWLISATQKDPVITMLAVVVWGGAAICMEDQLVDFQVRPSRASLVAGLTLLIYATWRSIVVLDLDIMVYVLPIIQGLGLALMARPVRKILSFGQSLFVLSLLFLNLLAFRILPEYWLSITTGKLGHIFLLMFDVKSESVGRILSTGGSGVSIQPACSGSGMIAQLTVIAIVFLLAFPIKSISAKVIFLVGAPVIGYLVNVWRITLLAVISGSSLSQKQQLFDFMHDEWGGLVFSGIATLIVGQIYMTIIDRQLANNRG